MIYFEYRIYEVGGEVSETIFGLSKPRTLIEQESIVVLDKESFKEHIRETYGKNTKFARSKKMEDGQLYCVVVTKGPAEQFGYLNEMLQFKCAYCGKEFKKTKRYTQYDKLINHSHYMLTNKTRYDYCCHYCQTKHYEQLRFEEKEKNDGVDINDWINREDYKYGFIYKITKRSTKEFYIGQTNSLPIFRWAQHLRTERFPIENVDDYIFEILETVKNKELINDIEMKYIKEYAEIYPLLILNKVGVTTNKTEEKNG